MEEDRKISLDRLSPRGLAGHTGGGCRYGQQAEQSKGRTCQQTKWPLYPAGVKNIAFNNIIVIIIVMAVSVEQLTV